MSNKMISERSLILSVLFRFGATTMVFEESVL